MSVRFWCNSYDKSVPYFISIGEGEELWEVEDDGHEEEGEGVAQPRLGAEAELKAMDRLLKLPIYWTSSDWQIHLGCVESWTGEHLLTSNTLIYALLYIRPEGEIEWGQNSFACNCETFLSPIVVLVVVLNSQEGVGEDVYEGHSNGRTQPAVKSALSASSTPA